MLKRPIRQIKQISEATSHLSEKGVDKEEIRRRLRPLANKYGPKITPAVHKCVVQAIADAKAAELDAAFDTETLRGLVAGGGRKA